MSLPDIPLGRAFGGLYRWGVVGMLAALGALALLLGLQLRGHLRAQILSRDASLLGAVVELERGDASALEEDALLEGALAASELRDVVGLLATDPAGQPLALIPTSLMLAGLGERDRARAVEEGPFARFHRAFPLALLFDDMLDEEARVPLVEVVVPFAGEEGEVVFFAQFWVDGQVMAREFAVLDRRLLGQGVLAWIAAAAAVSLVFIVALERLRRSARMLDARTLELERMNRELELAARSAAVGSISAHLLHGLKSPLAGLRAYLRAHGDGEALAATGRMQQLVHETLRLLGEEDRGRGREVPLEELFADLRGRLEPRLEVDEGLAAGPAPSLTLPRRVANLLGLVLENLVENAIEAAPGSPAVTISARVEGAGLAVRVSDRAGGVPAAVRERLFTPGVSGKADGSGLGLAISRQLMRALGGDLVLESSDAQGSCFRLDVPLERPPASADKV